MRVDTHHHVWDLAVRDQPWTAGQPALRRSFAVDELTPALTAHRIDVAVVVQNLARLDETRELLAASTDPIAPIRRSVVGWVDLTAPQVSDQLDELRAAPGGSALVGIRHAVVDEPDPQWLLRPEVLSGLRAVRDAGLAFDLLLAPRHRDAAVEAVRRVPDLRFVLDHAGSPRPTEPTEPGWRQVITEFAAAPNVMVKLSGLVTALPDPDARAACGETLLTGFGPGRIIYGSDWPVCLLAGDYDQVIGLAEELTRQLSPGERADVFGDSARRWYEL